jgi:uncharacterized protein YcfL
MGKTFFLLIAAFLLVLSGCSATPTTVTVTGSTVTTTSTVLLPPVTQTITTTTTTTTTMTTTTTSTATTTTNATVTVTPTPKVIFSDDFNSEVTGAVPSKWTVIKPSDTDISIDGTVYFGTSGKSAKIQDNSSTEVPIINKTIASQTGRFWYEISLRLMQTNQIIGGVYIGNSSVSGGRYGIENLGVSITFWSDGYIKYNDNDNDLLSWKNIQTYQADKWYTIKVLVDVPNQRFNIYIDDVLKLTDVKFRYPMTSLDQISVVSRVELPASTIWIDNVLATEAP